jgi:hypothetical protein
MSSTWIRPLLLSLVVAGAAGIAARGAPSIEARSVAAAGGQCSNIGMNITPLRTSGAAGHIGEMFRIHKITGGSCTLRGYPGALLLDTSFVSMQTHVTRGFANLAGPNAPATVTLTPQHDAYFIVVWPQIPSPGETCPRARYVMFTAPNDFLPVVTYAGKRGGGIGACGGNLTVSPVAGHAFSF